MFLIRKRNYSIIFMRGCRKFCQRGTTSNIFLFDQGGPKTTISGPSSLACHGDDDGPTLNAGLVAL